jgi:hypothetical protein
MTAALAASPGLAYHAAMSRNCRRFPLQNPRLALLTLLVLAFIAQSLIGISGQTHEVLLHADAGETYTHQHVSHDHQTPVDGGAEDDSRSPFHPLLHPTCGGQCTWAMGDPSVQAAVFLISAAIPAQSALRVDAADYTAPFRPPIPA